MTSAVEANAAANLKLTHSIMASEMEQTASWNAIDTLDLTTDSDASGIEACANDAFAASINALRMATRRQN